MATRQLTFEEQDKLYILMKNNKVKQRDIAEANNLNSSVIISRVCRGEYNITPSIKRYFNKCNINLDDVMDPSFKPTLNPTPVKPKKPKPRCLTLAESRKVYAYLKKHKISQQYIAWINNTYPSYVCKILKRRSSVTPLAINIFMRAGVDLESIIRK